MAANPDFKKIVTGEVELRFPRLDQTYRFNNAAKATEACPPTAQNAAWSTGFALPMNEAKALKAELIEHYNQCRERNRKLPEFSKVFGSKVILDDEGNKTNFVHFSAKRNAVTGAGKAARQPSIVGVDLQPFDAARLWTGTIGRLRMNAVPTTDPDGFGGVSLLLDAVQIIKPEYGGDNLEDDFGPAQKPSFDEFGAEERQDVEERAKAPATSDMDEF